ncbi:MAG: type II secretion system protein [Blastocatellia bacterium]
MSISHIHQVGFSLLEMIIVMAIMSVMVTAAWPIARNIEKRRQEQELKEVLRRMRDGIDKYKKFCEAGGVPPLDRKPEDQCYPPNLDTLVEGVTPPNSLHKIRFLSRIPRDPMTGGTDWSTRSAQDEPDTRSSGSQNVYDVFSRSEDIGLNGTKYRDW